MKSKKNSAVSPESFPAPHVAGGPTIFHPAFRAYTQGRMPFPGEIDFYAMLDAEPWIYEAEQDFREEIDALSSELSEAIQELTLLRMPQDCHAEEKALALLLSIGNGRFVQDLYEAMQTAMFDMAVRLDADEKWVVKNIEHWLETGEPAGREESKLIYEQLNAALRAAGK